MDNCFRSTPYKNSVAHQLINSSMKDDIFERFLQYGIKKTGACFKSFVQLKDLYVPLKQNYLVSLHYGEVDNPVRLFLTKKSGIRFSFLILPDQTVYSVKYRFDPHLYDRDTLFEGYLVDDYYYITDIVVHQGRVVDKYIQDRLKLLNVIIDEQFRADIILDVATIVVNDYLPMNQLESFLHQSKESYGKMAMGLLFTPLNSDIIHYYLDFADVSPKSLSGKDQNPNKLNDSSGSSSGSLDNLTDCSLDTTKSICFKMKQTDKPDLYELYLKHGSGERYMGLASIPDKDTSQRALEFLGGQKYCVVKCKYDTTFHRWTPYMRSSRKSPDEWSLVKQPSQQLISND